MLSVSILTVKRRSINSQGLVYPICRNKHRLQEARIKVVGIFEDENNVPGCDVLIVDSKYYKGYWSTRSQEALMALNRLREKSNKLYWFDSGDSTGLIQSQVLPFVDYYLKAQTLKDKSLYGNSLYGGRIYTDYFHDQIGVTDSKPDLSQCVTPSDQKKILTAWNYGLVSGYGRIDDWSSLVPAGLANKLYRFRKNRYNFSNLDSRSGLFLRMNLSYDRETVAYQRVKTIDLLKNFRIASNKISKRQYLSEIRESKVVVSPFGWGEINIRDFECFVAGSILVKPSMSHVSTFPHYYKGQETYLPVRWDLDDLESKVEEILLNDKKFLEIAAEGQKHFRYFVEGNNGQEEFVDYVGALLTRKNSTEIT